MAKLANTSDPLIFTESIFLMIFDEAKQDSYAESTETYTSLFEDRNKYIAIMHALA